MEDIFYAAAELGSAAEREAFLSRECGGDRELRAEVDRLLTMQPQAEKFFGEIDAAGVLRQKQQ